MSRFIYSIYDIFSSDPQNGCLGQNNVSGFFIDVYQRGYKWDSECDNIESYLPVNTMLRDICDAYKKDPDSTYVLQFITVKKRSWEDHGYLEVIDGQQRLTTLSILFSVFKKIKKESFQDFVNQKICYSLKNAGSSLLNKFHDCYQDDYPSAKENNDQTAWFMRKAREALYSLLKNKGDEELKNLYDYISGKVLLIVNQVEENLCGEDIFENLNSRKVFLTNVELIKGLLLCKAVRVDIQASYKELTERRTHLGRQWDEIQRCFHNSEFGAFFSENKDKAFYDFLLLVLAQSKKELSNQDEKKLYEASEEEDISIRKHYCLFNKYYSLIKDAADTHCIFQKLLELFWRMHDIYTDTRKHNLIGFMLFFSRGFDKFTELKTILSLDETALMQRLQNQFSGEEINLSDVQSFIKNYNYSYSNQPEKIRRDLLLVNCFNTSDSGEKKLIPNPNRKFPFFAVDRSLRNKQGKMNSLEHIHPQNPPEFNEDEFDPSKKPDLTAYITCAMAEELFTDLQSDFTMEDLDLAKRYETDNSIEIEPDRLKKLYQFYSDITQKHHAEFEKEIPGKGISFLHSIGNLVLLLGGQNSAEGNHNFSKKRQILRDWINKGEMVPDHTFDAFSKIGCKHSQTLNCWTTQDVLDNAEYTLTEIYKRLSVIFKKEEEMAE